MRDEMPMVRACLTRLGFFESRKLCSGLLRVIYSYFFYNGRVF
jgi:hypothetical protein